MTLIERLEAATGPDRELDAEIFRYLNPQYGDAKTWPRFMGGLRHINDGSDMRTPPQFQIKHFTASIDAAMALVDTEGGDRVRHMTFYPAAMGMTEKWAVCVENEKTRYSYGGEVQHIPLAICIAALKARGEG